MENGKLMNGLYMAVTIAAVMVSTGFARKPEVVSGNPGFLKEQQNFVVKLDFSEVRFYDENSVNSSISISALKKYLS